MQTRCFERTSCLAVDPVPGTGAVWYSTFVVLPASAYMAAATGLTRSIADCRMVALMYTCNAACVMHRWPCGICKNMPARSSQYARMMQQLHQQQQLRGPLVHLCQRGCQTEPHLGNSQQVTKVTAPCVQQRLVQVRLQPQAVLRVHG